MKIKHFPLLCILWLALAVRVWGLLEAPPGLTHDEANHGREAMSLLDGQLTFYFPLNYGSEPLYSYTVAGVMALLGESVFALRLVGAMFGVLTIALSYKWVQQLWGEQPGRWLALLMAVSYWAIVSSRMALRATLLPFFMLAAVYCFWHILRPGSQKQWQWVGLFGFLVAVTLHIYLAARLLWLLFPLTLAWLWFTNRPLFQRSWRPVTAGLLLAGLLVTPLFVYLQFHPEADTRLEMFSVFNAVLAGDFRPLFTQMWSGLSAFFWPGAGDQFLAYNIPGRPVFDPLTAGLAAVGLAAALWQGRDGRYSFLLLWLAIGIAPSLITGATANTTRNMGALPVIYLLPVLGAYTLFSFPLRPLRSLRFHFLFAHLLPLLWLAGVGFTSVYAYFGLWANLPEVRGAYQTTIMAAMRYGESQHPAGTPLLFSSVYPGAAHDNSIGMVLLKEKERPVRWMDGRLALIWPAGEQFPLYVPSSTPLHPHFGQWVSQATTHALRPTDLDPAFTAYTLTPPLFEGQLANFNEGVQLVAAYWLAEEVPAGGVAELVTVWRVLDPGRVGPIVPPAYQTDAVMFAQVLRPEGTVLTQADYLMAPSWGWQSGDTVVQIFQMGVPGEAPAGEYQTIVGVYDRTSGARLNVVETGQSFAPILPLNIVYLE